MSKDATIGVDKPSETPARILMVFLDPNWNIDLVSDFVADDHSLIQEIFDKVDTRYKNSVGVASFSFIYAWGVVE